MSKTRFILWLIAISILIGSSISIALAQTKIRSAGSTTSNHFHVVHGWPIVPENTILDEVSAVAVDSHDNVLVLQRGGRKWPEDGKFDTTPIPVSTVFVFDGRNGRLLKKWGENALALPHSITVDHEDNIWIADVALHQVFKFSRDGKLMMQLGERGSAGDDNKHFNEPSDVAIAPDGSIFVSDGYGNARIVKFGPDGKFLLSWGTKGKEPGQFDLPHGLTIDGDRVFVVDRRNRRVQIFDLQGRFVAQWKGPPFAAIQEIATGSDHLAYVVQMGPETLPDTTGVLVLRPDGSLIERIGQYGNYDGQFYDIHWVALAKSGAVYTADFEGRRVQKFIRGQTKPVE